MKAKLWISTLFSLVGWLGLLGNSHATLLFSDDFNEADITSQHTNFTSLDNWDVVDGTVDAYVDGGFGLPCLSAGCLDMDGSSVNGGRIETKTTFNFLANSTYHLTIGYRGNARGGDDDITIGFTSFGSGTIPVNWAVDWTTTGLSVWSSSDWSGKLFVETSSNDNVGPLLDWVTLRDELNGEVPVPAPLSLMSLFLLGFGYRRIHTRR